MVLRDASASKNARKQTNIKIQFYNREKVTSFKIFILTFSLSPNDQDDYFVQVQHDHNHVHHHDHDLVRDHDDHDDLDQVLHALLRALHQEGERKAEEEISKHARGGIEYQQLWQ